MSYIHSDQVDKGLNLLQSEINKILDNELKYFLENIPDSLHELVTYYYNQGGKRLRPALFMIFCNNLNSNNQIGPYSLAIELIHTMSLYHDDVIDGAEERRGSPTVHTKWDNASAIIGGDILHSNIHRHILVSAKDGRIDTDSAIAFLEELTKAEVQIGSAVIEEMQLAGKSEFPSLEKVKNINANKTAPLFAFSSKIAAIISRKEDLAQRLYKIGWSLGEAFQLLDDLLDFYPSNKDIAGDLRENKKTPLLHLAWKKDDKTVQKYLEQTTYSLKEAIEFRRKFSDVFLTISHWIKEKLDYVQNSLKELEISDPLLDLIIDILSNRLHNVISSLNE